MEDPNRPDVESPEGWTVLGLYQSNNQPFATHVAETSRDRALVAAADDMAECNGWTRREARRDFLVVGCFKGNHIEWSCLEEATLAYYLPGGRDGLPDDEEAE